MGLHRTNPRILREMVGEVTKPLHHLSSVLAHSGGPRQLEAGQCDTYPQERLEGRSRELQNCQSDLSGREGYGTDYQDNQRARPQRGFRKGRSLLDQPDLFYDWVTCLVDEGKAVHLSTLLFVLVLYLSC